MYYNSTSKGVYVATNTFSATYNSLPYGKIEIDPQNGNIGLIMGNSYSMWTLGGLSDSGSDTQFLPVGTYLYSGIPSGELILTKGNRNDVDNITIVSNTTGLPAYTPNSYVNLLYSIDNCSNGIKISFAQKTYMLNGNSDGTHEFDIILNTSISNIKIPKGVNTATTLTFLDGNNQSTFITATVSGNSLSFTTSSLNYPNIPGTYNQSMQVFYVIASIIAY